MAGVAEGLGFALAVVPIIMSVAEHVSDISSVWFRYRHYGVEVHRHALALKTQRVIFKNDLVALLASCVGKAKAIDMFKAPNDMAWKESLLEDFLNERLCGHKSLFLELTQIIHRELRAAEEKACKFSDAFLTARRSDRGEHELGPEITSQPPVLLERLIDAEKARMVTWKDSPAASRVRKTQFALSGKPLQEDVQQLRNLINDFHVLTEQLLKRSDIRPLEQPSASSRRDIEKFHQVQVVSQALYDALGTACTVHSSHHVLLGLQPTIKDTLLHIQFNMALRHNVTDTHIELGAPIWLSVESQLEKSSTEQPVLNLQTSCNPQGTGKKRTRSPSPPADRQMPPNNRSRQISDLVETVQLQAALEPPLRNLCRSKNFCTQLLKLIRSPTYHSSYCLGFLEHPQRVKHLIYLNNHLHINSVQNTLPTSTSLAELFDCFHRKGTRAASLPQFERLRFARMLATALLQFHATPWLSTTWGSKDVFFRGIDPSSPDEISQFAEPFISVLIKDDKRTLINRAAHPTASYQVGKQHSLFASSPDLGNSKSISPQSQTTGLGDMLIRNPMLYGLGVMLLELAFEAPIRALPTPFALRHWRHAGSAVPELVEYQKVKSLSLGTPSTLGPQFSKIIRKCIDCDFARGTDLNDPVLQEGVYREVVCELKSLEDSFRALQITS